ncbi:MAG: hypothetical protein ABIZ36_07465 [Gemmatimonadaceae bacterium]
MFGCIRRLGCLVFFLIIAVVAWFNRDRLEGIYRRYAGGPPSIDSSAVIRANGGWEALSTEKGAVGKKKVESLGVARNAPGYVNLTPGEASSFILSAVIRQLPTSTQQVTTSVKGDRLYVKGNMDLAEIGGTKALGPLGAMLGARDTIQLGGTIKVLGPGLGEFNVQDVKIGSFPIPSALIPKLVGRMRKGTLPAGISPEGIPMKMPAYVGDVRIADGRLTVYKTTQ